MLKFFVVSFFVFVISCVSVESPVMEVAVNEEEFSYLLYNLDTEEIVVSSNADTVLIPASVFKLLTAYAFLEVLGYDKKFHTEVYYNGDITSGGVLDGDLIIRGGGDPSLGYEDLFNIASLVARRGIRKVTGNLIYQDDLFISLLEINNNQPFAKYNPGISSLALREGYFFFRGGGEDKEDLLIPNVGHISFKVVPEIYVPQYIEKHSWVVQDEIEYQLPIRDSAFFVANIFNKALEYNNVNVSGIKKGGMMSAKLLFRYDSDPLLKILRYNLNFSHNLTSEILLLQFANAIKCDHDSLSGAAQCLQDWYGKRFVEMDWEGLQWENGSGLSAITNITALHILEVLKELYGSEYGADTGVSLLPISGLSGTLKHKFLENPFQIWAKTGSMYFVSTLAGYLFSEDNRYAFVILANDKEMRDRLDNLDEMQQKEEYVSLKEYAQLWKAKIYKMQKELIRVWVGGIK